MLHFRTTKANNFWHEDHSIYKVLSGGRDLEMPKRSWQKRSCPLMCLWSIVDRTLCSFRISVGLPMLPSSMSPYYGNRSVLAMLEGCLCIKPTMYWSTYIYWLYASNILRLGPLMKLWLILCPCILTIFFTRWHAGQNRPKGPWLSKVKDVNLSGHYNFTN